MRTRKSRATKTRGKAKPATKERRGRPKVRLAAPAPAPGDAAGHSVIKQKYRERYEDGSYGDSLARKLRKYLKTETGTAGLAKLQQLAERNGVWVPCYASLNPGAGADGRRQQAKETV